MSEYWGVGIVGSLETNFNVRNIGLSEYYNINQFELIHSLIISGACLWHVTMVVKSSNLESF